VTRRAERWKTFARGAARRFLVSARRLLTVDPDPTAPAEVDAGEAAAAQELARSAAELRGGMAKMAQLMAYARGPGAAADADARRALAVLWDRARGVEAGAVREVIRAELGAAPEELFAEWSDAPFAAASLGQVHAATARDGTRLAVKVQYPGVAEALRSDLESPRLLRALAGTEIGAALSPGARARLVEAVLGELDYRAEGVWLERFRAAFAGTKDVVIPRHVPELSGARVLSAERIDGRPLLEAAAELDEDARARVALALFRFAWGGPLRHRLLNCDPNPGNYLVLPDGRTAFLDFGCAAELDEETVRSDRKIWRAILAQDGEALRHAVYEEGLLGHARALDASNFREWERHLAGPYLHGRPFRWTPGYARAWAEHHSTLVRAGGLVLLPPAVLLWRQRLGVAAVIGELHPRADFAAELAELLLCSPA
jgi:predicted unusual protein kinase regulating ubiquinone biosynthesis (AarF/ABC1/UbiB family)